MSATELPTPDGWKSRVVPIGLALALSFCGAVYFGYKTVLAVQNTHWIAAVILCAAAMVFTGAVAGAASTLLGRTPVRASFDDVGTKLLSAQMTPWIIAMLIALIVGCGLYLLDGSHLHADLPVLTGRDHGRVIGLLVCGILGLGVTIRSAARGRPQLTVTPQGVDYADGSGRFTLSWDEVTDIVGVAPRGKTFRPVVFERTDGAPAVITNAALWTPAGRALFWMLRHYWSRPSDRNELTNGVAIDRLTNGRFTE